ncbi:3-hydroxyacyl-CoA dehydrogenase family protein [Haloarcula japonica]|uniref:3-hydroxyacyl-CoA dehydrogenase n=1 Tax=Haloarcula japonica (strain ATCC 49778 / DSM 6131 / JCM 7785 / NBRC 101032 / NCIMB 13157 / TR-1) TaxID=1227453 RepID=M0L821_HALJT|nr:3-hydroxyacyl-CoA dehydrogenase family protein [Haloarcula japonica]EMA29757.1 3-hydroxyacyl-CoA dehydrogenase [Haloarcula japonica DSM 6131]
MIVAVLGTGRRGRDIAQRCVRAGHEVRLRGTDATDVMDRVDEIRRALNRDVSAGIDGTTGLESAVSGSDIVIDATDGGTESHRDVVAETETMIEDETLIAVSDTSLSVTAVATGLRSPDRAVGLNPVDPPDGAIVEVVIAEQTTVATRDRVTDFVESLDASPIVVRDTPGFAALRLELATIAEAVRMVEDGVAGVRDIDRTFERGESDRDGPLVRADKHGLETVLAAFSDLADRLDERFEPPALLRQKVEDGQLGAVTGEGFYVWEDGEPTTGADPDPDVPTRDSEPDLK